MGIDLDIQLGKSTIPVYVTIPATITPDRYIRVVLFPVEEEAMQDSG
jgi:hypothetical protein